MDRWGWDGMGCDITNSKSPPRRCGGKLIPGDTTTQPTDPLLCPVERRDERKKDKTRSGFWVRLIPPQSTCPPRRANRRAAHPIPQAILAGLEVAGYWTPTGPRGNCVPERSSFRISVFPPASASCPTLQQKPTDEAIPRHAAPSVPRGRTSAAVRWVQQSTAVRLRIITTPWGHARPSGRASRRKVGAQGVRVECQQAHAVARPSCFPQLPGRSPTSGSRSFRPRARRVKQTRASIE